MRTPKDPNATPEQNAARVIQNAASVFSERAERFASICERYAEDMDPQARDLLETWVRRWAVRLVNATQPARKPLRDGLNLLDGTGPAADAPPADPEATL